MSISPRQLLVLVALATSPVAAFAQGGSPVRVSTAQAEFRAAPDGARVATLSRDASVTPGATNGAWREVTLEGWIPARTVTPAGSGGRLAVQGGATLRATPGGAAVATADGGMVLREVERRGAWVQVRRTGWVRADGLGSAAERSSSDARRTTPAPSAAKSAPAATSRPARDTASRRAAPARARTTGSAPATPSAALTRGSPSAPASRPAASAAPRRPPVVLHAAPDGAVQVAEVEPDAAVQVLAREGEWTRVRVEGWTRAPVAGQATAATRGPVTLAALRADPDAFVGREVDWTLRFVAVQVADSVRSDFRPGEAFLLTRDPNGETGFVYVAVTPQQAVAARRFAPLQQFRMTGRIRVPRSPLMGHPIVELVRLR